MSVFENYLQRAIDALEAGSGDLFSQAVHDLHDHTGIPGVGGGGGGFSDLLSISENGTIVTFPDGSPQIIAWSPTVLGGALYRTNGTAISWNIANPTRLTINTTGYYDFDTSLAVSGPTSASAYGSALFYINGTPTNYALPAPTWMVQNSIILTIQAKLKRIALTAGDYVEVAGIMVGDANISPQELLVVATRVA